MECRAIGARGWWPRVVGIILIGLAVISPADGGRVAAREENQGQPLDLAAMTLRPEDLAEVGLDGYGAGRGTLHTAESFVARFAGMTGEAPDDVEADLIDEAGLLGNYWVRVALPLDPDDPDANATRGLYSAVYPFGDVEGAERGLEILSAASVSFAFGVDEEIIAVDEDIAVGDGARLVEISGVDDETGGDAIETLVLFFQSGQIVGEVSLWDIRRDGERRDEPEVEEVAALAEATIERIDAALDGDAPGLGAQAVRLVDDDLEITTRRDLYTVIDGEVIARYGESEREAEARAEWGAHDGIVDAYLVEQGVVTGRELKLSDPYVYAFLYRFEDEAAASDWLEDEAFAGFEEDPGFTIFERIDDVEPVGDDLAAAAYVFETADGRSLGGHTVAVRVGDVVVRFAVESGDGVGLEPVLELAEIQADCLNAGACEGPAALPDGLVES